MKNPSKSVVDLIADMEPWTEGLMILRDIILAAGLTEDIKWGGPTYYYGTRKLMAIGGFKHYFSIWFHQGVFLSDPAGVLINAGEGKTRALRQWRFSSVAEVKPALVKKYVQEAIRNAQSGKEIKPEKKAPLAVPDEMKTAFKKDKALASAFAALTPGRQREYLEYIGEAKTEATRIRRLEKCVPIIRDGRGLNDRYV